MVHRGRSGKGPGKRKQQWQSVKGTKKDAERRLGELLQAVDNGSYVKPEKMTVGEHLENWLKEYVLVNTAPRTAEDYEMVIRLHLIPALGNLPLSRLRPEHIQRYYSDKLTNGRCDGKGGLSPKTVRNHHHILHSTLQNAMKLGLIVRNPADAVAVPRVQRSEVQAWDKAEVTAFLEGIKGTTYYPIFYLALYTGMRRSEILALRWQDVDLLLGQVYVSRSLHRLKGGELVFRSTKSDKGRRTIALPPSAVLLLREHREKQQLEKAMMDSTLGEDDLVFGHPDGTPFVPDTITHVWQKILKKSEIKRIRLHDARHTHATVLPAQGVHPKIVQERLGHSSIQMTIDTYSHVLPGLQEAAALRFDEFLQTPSENTSTENFGLQNVCKNENSPRRDIP